jgi:hypothetical protein
MGARLCIARAERGWGEDFRLTILRAPWRGAGARHREQLTPEQAFAPFGHIL